MAVSIHLKQFDGPLDLLLHLVGKAKIDLADIFVSEITEQYIEIVRGAPDFDHGRGQRIHRHGRASGGNQEPPPPAQTAP